MTQLSERPRLPKMCQKDRPHDTLTVVIAKADVILTAPTANVEG